MAERVSAQKDTVREEGVDAVLDGVTDVYSTRGRKVLHVDLETEKPAREEVLALLLGRSGALRAPVVKCRNTLVVGFHEETYARVLG